DQARPGEAQASSAGPGADLRAMRGAPGGAVRVGDRHARMHRPLLVRPGGGLSWRTRVSRWRDSRASRAAKRSLPALGRVTAERAPRPSTAPAVPICGARDRLSGAVCSLLSGHWADHADDSEPDTVIRWPQEGAVA